MARPEYENAIVSLISVLFTYWVYTKLMELLSNGASLTKIAGYAPCDVSRLSTTDIVSAFTGSQPIPLHTPECFTGPKGLPALERCILALRCVQWLACYYLHSVGKLEGDIQIPANPFPEEWTHRSISGLKESPQLYAVVGNPADKVVWVIVRGSQTEYDWLQVDFQTTQIQYNYVKRGGGHGSANIHVGFFRIAALILAEVENYIRTYGRPTKIAVAGHSLGAAVTSVFTMMATNKYPDIEFDMYATACPLAGNREFATAFEGVTGYLLTNSADLVPHTPISVMPNAVCPFTGYSYVVPALPAPGGMFTFTLAETNLQLNHISQTYLNALLGVLHEAPKEGPERDAIFEIVPTMPVATPTIKTST